VKFIADEKVAFEDPECIEAILVALKL